MKTSISELNVYLVGGAVRDEVMGATPKDRDYVVIGSSPEEMISLGFEQVGADFPVFLHPETKEEYALARRERKVGAGYLGFECEFGADVTLEDDLFRRDFACNAMAKDLKTGQIIDPFGGQKDIRDGVIRVTSDAFKEDPLRVLRMARFAARYDWGVSMYSVKLAREVIDSGALNELPAERFWRELEKVLDDDCLHDFFNKLDFIGPVNSVFFKNALPRRNFVRLGWINSLDQLSAVASNEKTTIWPSATAKRLASAIRNLKFSDAESTYETLLRLDAFRMSSLVDDVISMEMLRVISAGDVKLLKIAVKLCNTVTAADFHMMGGALLGKAIKEKRIELLKCLFE